MKWNLSFKQLIQKVMGKKALERRNWVVSITVMHEPLFSDFPLLASPSPNFSYFFYPRLSLSLSFFFFPNSRDYKLNFLWLLLASWFLAIADFLISVSLREDTEIAFFYLPKLTHSYLQPRTWRGRRVARFTPRNHEAGLHSCGKETTISHLEIRATLPPPFFLTVE